MPNAITALPTTQDWCDYAPDFTRGDNMSFQAIHKRDGGVVLTVLSGVSVTLVMTPADIAALRTVLGRV